MSIKFKAKVLLSVLMIGGVFFKISDFHTVHCMKRGAYHKRQETILPAKTCRVDKDEQDLSKEWFRLLEEGSIPELANFISRHGKKYVNWWSGTGALPLNCVERVDVARFLLDNGAEVNAVDAALRSPLRCAVVFLECEDGKHNHDMVELLLERGANVNFYYWPAGTVLHDAAFRGDIALMRLLLRYKADFNIVDGRGLTPFEVCRKFNRYEPKVLAELNSLIREISNKGGEEYEDDDDSDMTDICPRVCFE